MMSCHTAVVPVVRQNIMVRANGRKKQLASWEADRGSWRKEGDELSLSRSGMDWEKRGGGGCKMTTTTELGLVWKG